MKYLIGNWKMSIDLQGINNYSQALRKTKFPSGIKYGLACPNLYVDDLKKMLAKTDWKVGVQNVCYAENGAFTGEVAAHMLKDKGINFSLIGHSERRTLFMEDNEVINKKLIRLLKNGIIPVFCIGETSVQYEQKQTKRVLSKQLKEGLANVDEINKVVVAYEPVWAIGTGKSASPKDIKESIMHIKQTLRKMYPNAKKLPPVLYGGSVKPSNAAEIFAIDCVDGALVGGASLDCAQFFGIAKNM